MQSKLFNHETSGSIVLVQEESGAGVNSIGAANSLVLAALENLETAGATRIVLDTPLRESGNIDLDRALRSKINEMSEAV
ncbi:MAG: hypothetical protein AAFW59_05840, partial [Pseudomonadota bacterium]